MSVLNTMLLSTACPAWSLGRLIGSVPALSISHDVKVPRPNCVSLAVRRRSDRRCDKGGERRQLVQLRERVEARGEGARTDGGTVVTSRRASVSELLWLAVIMQGTPSRGMCSAPSTTTLL